MLRTLSTSVLVLGLASTAMAQDLIYYPFLTGSGTSVTNLWKGGSAKGLLTTTNTTNKGWAKGVGGVGFALAGKDASGTSCYVDTGLNQGTGTSLFKGSFTLAFFIKEAWTQTSANTLAYFISGVGSFRMFTGGVAQEGLYLRVWGGAPSDLVLRGPTNKLANQPFFDLRAAAKKGWVHIAVVVDSTASLATYYVNGSPFSTQQLTTPSAAPTGTGNLLVGRHGSGSTSNFDLDDFRLTNRAAAPHEIQQWANAKLQADVTQVSISGPGSQKLSLNAGIAQAARSYWIFGSVTGTWPGVTLGPVSIPLVPDLYTGITISLPNTPMLTRFRGIIGRDGKASAQFNVPAKTPAAAVGVTAWHAYTTFNSSGTVFDASNAVPIQFIK